MEHSPEIAKLALALIKVQSKLEHAKKNSENPFFKSKYADLATVIDASRKLLTDNGLAVTQLVGGGPDVASVTTMLVHESGEWLRDTVTGKPVKNDPQGIGSLITYLRRYSYQAIVGFSSEEDDDGNAASNPEPKQKLDFRSRSVVAIDKAKDVKSLDAIAEKLELSFAEKRMSEADHKFIAAQINRRREEIEK